MERVSPVRESTEGGQGGGDAALSPLASPLIVTCAITGDHSPQSHSALPVSASEQAAAAEAATAAGAAIVHVHGRDPRDHSRPASEVHHYTAIADAIRQRVPEAIVDFTQSAAPVVDGENLFRYTALAVDAAPDMMSLNPGPMTFRAGPGRPSSAVISTFEDTARIATLLRSRGVKPQVFLYHPGHLDLLEYLIERDVLEPPYWLQLVFGQQSGMPAAPEMLLFMVKNLPTGSVFQACGVGRASIEAGLLSLLLGGHVRTGMEDALEYRPGEPVVDNAQLVSRVVRFATDLGRPIATAAQTRAMIGLADPSN